MHVIADYTMLRHTMHGSHWLRVAGHNSSSKIGGIGIWKIFCTSPVPVYHHPITLARTLLEIEKAVAAHKPVLPAQCTPVTRNHVAFSPFFLDPFSGGGWGPISCSKHSTCHWNLPICSSHTNSSSWRLFILAISDSCYIIHSTDVRMSASARFASLHNNSTSPPSLPLLYNTM